MTSITSLAEDNAFLRGVCEALTEKVREGLKEPLRKQAEELIDKVVEEAVAALRLKIEAAVSAEYNNLDLRLVIQRPNEAPE